MSEFGQIAIAPQHAIGVWRFDMHLGKRFSEHDHAEHQLVWAPAGVLTVEIGEQFWILPPTLALWVPAGTIHATSATKPTSMAGMYFVPDQCPVSWDEPTVIAGATAAARSDPPPREPGAQCRDAPSHGGAGLRLLKPVTVTTISVPMPPDPRAREVADRLLADPADDRTVEAWAQEVGASVRTLSRLFVGGTGMSFTQWRTNARMRAALTLLAEGKSTKTVARQVGYATVSAFVSTFHRVTGQTPGAYFRV